jgi:hypothetical protein
VVQGLGTQPGRSCSGLRRIGQEASWPVFDAAGSRGRTCSSSTSDTITVTAPPSGPGRPTARLPIEIRCPSAAIRGVEGVCAGRAGVYGGLAALVSALRGLRRRRRRQLPLPGSLVVVAALPGGAGIGGSAQAGQAGRQASQAVARTCRSSPPTCCGAQAVSTGRCRAGAAASRPACRTRRGPAKGSRRLAARQADVILRSWRTPRISVGVLGG